MLTNGEAATLHDPKTEAKETRSPPRYDEGSLIEAMQNAWRFVDDAPLRERLKDAKGIGTPATRAEIINGLKRQKFLTNQGKNIVPTEHGLELFAVLSRADPTLVDPGATAQLEQLLDNVVAGKQQMEGAIDAVCQVADRIITKLKSEAESGNGPILKSHTAQGDTDRPPTPAMKRFAMSLAREKRLHLPRGYAKSIDVCRAFLEAHAPDKSKNPSTTSVERPPSSAQLAYSKNIAETDGIAIPVVAMASAAAMSSWIEKQRGKKRSKARVSASSKKRTAQEHHADKP
jgi:DNA topoisomerase-3